MNQTTQKEQSKTIYRTPMATRILLCIVITVGAALTAMMPDVITAAICAAFTGGVFAFYYVLTFSPAAVFTSVPAYLIALLLTRDAFSAASTLLFLPVGAVLSLCMLKRKNKTTACVSAAAAIGLSVLVLFLISYMRTHGTIAPDALRESYNSAFASLRELLLTSTG